MTETGAEIVRLFDTCLVPKRIVGVKRNVQWEYEYDKDTRMWYYRVVVAMPPQIFTGHQSSETKTKERVAYLIKCGVA